MSNQEDITEKHQKRGEKKKAATENKEGELLLCGACALLGPTAMLTTDKNKCSVAQTYLEKGVWSAHG